MLQANKYIRRGKYEQQRRRYRSSICKTRIMSDRNIDKNGDEEGHKTTLYYFEVGRVAQSV